MSQITKTLEIDLKQILIDRGVMQMKSSPKRDRIIREAVSELPAVKEQGGNVLLEECNG